MTTPSEPPLSKQSTSLVKIAARAGVGLALFALITISSVAITRALTTERIAANREASAYRAVAEVAPTGHDGHLLDHSITLPAAPTLGQLEPFTAWQAISDGEIIGLVVPVISSQGYSGRIGILVGITTDATLSGVRVTEHRETPGLGDAIEARKSGWIMQFQGLSLNTPPIGGWATSVDGGGIDTLTGATITSRAVIQAVHGTLQWYRERDTERQASQVQPQTQERSP